MSEITLQQSLQKKGLRMTFLILCGLFISEYTFSQDKWSPSFVNVTYNKLLDYISIKIDFFKYEFGPFGEHGYLELCDFKYSLEGRHYIKIMSCEVEDQHQHEEISIITMKDKLPGSVMAFYECHKPTSGSQWLENKSVRVESNIVNFTGSIELRWFLSSNLKVYDIEINGKWNVSGLNCREDIGERYPVPYTDPLPPNQNFESNLKYINEQSLDQPKYKVLKVNKDADAIIIKGAELGDDIQVYATSGTLVKSIAADQDVVNIKLPPNQVYIVKVGLVRYKVAL